MRRSRWHRMPRGRPAVHARRARTSPSPLGLARAPPALPSMASRRRVSFMRDRFRPIRRMRAFAAPIRSNADALAARPAARGDGDQDARVARPWGIACGGADGRLCRRARRRWRSHRVHLAIRHGVTESGRHRRHGPCRAGPSLLVRLPTSSARPLVSGCRRPRQAPAVPRC